MKKKIDIKTEKRIKRAKRQRRIRIREKEESYKKKRAGVRRMRGPYKTKYTPLPWMEQFGNQIRAMREIRRFTQKDFAAEIGYGSAWVSRIENGLGTCSIEMLLKIAEVLECSWVLATGVVAQTDNKRKVTMQAGTVIE